MARTKLTGNRRRLVQEIRYYQRVLHRTRCEWTVRMCRQAIARRLERLRD